MTLKSKHGACIPPLSGQRLAVPRQASGSPIRRQGARPATGIDMKPAPAAGALLTAFGALERLLGSDISPAITTTSALEPPGTRRNAKAHERPPPKRRRTATRALLPAPGGPETAHAVTPGGTRRPPTEARPCGCDPSPGRTARATAAGAIRP